MKEETKEKIAIQYLFESEPDHAWTAKDISRTLGFRGKQIKRPGRVRKLLRRLNPFSGTPVVCDNLCGAYPQGCPTCDQNTWHRREEATGVAT